MWQIEEWGSQKDIAWWLARCIMSKPRRTFWSQHRVHLLKESSPCSQLLTQLTLEDSPTSVLWSYSQQVPPPGMHQFAGILVTVGHLSFLYWICFALLLRLKSSSYRLHINKRCVSLSEKSAGSICRQERRESIDFKKNWHPGLGENSDAMWEIPIDLLVTSPDFCYSRSLSPVPPAEMIRDCADNTCHLSFGEFQILFVYLAKHIVYLLESEVLFKDNCWKWKAILLREGEPFRRWTWEQWQLPVTCWVLFVNVLLGWPSGEHRQRRERRGQGMLSRPSSASHLFPLPHSTPSGVPAKRKHCSYSSFLSWTNNVTLECQVTWAVIPCNPGRREGTPVPWIVHSSLDLDWLPQPPFGAGKGSLETEAWVEDQTPGPWYKWKAEPVPECKTLNSLFNRFYAFS